MLLTFVVLEGASESSPNGWALFFSGSGMASTKLKTVEDPTVHHMCNSCFTHKPRDDCVMNTWRIYWSALTPMVDGLLY